jgi:hypothetical protein
MGTSYNASDSEVWFRSWTHLSVNRNSPRYCHVTIDHPPINIVLACDLRFASRENTLLGQWEVGVEWFPGRSDGQACGRALEILLVAHWPKADMLCLTLMSAFQHPAFVGAWLFFLQPVALGTARSRGWIIRDRN